MMSLAYLSFAALMFILANMQLVMIATTICALAHHLNWTNGCILLLHAICINANLKPLLSALEYVINKLTGPQHYTIRNGRYWRQLRNQKLRMKRNYMYISLKLLANLHNTRNHI